MFFDPVVTLAPLHQTHYTMSKPSSRMTPLNPVQLSLLRVFSREMTLEETRRVQKALLDTYEAELHEEVEAVIREKGYIDADFERVLKRQARTRKSRK